jgi:hypothetical protein
MSNAGKYTIDPMDLFCSQCGEWPLHPGHTCDPPPPGFCVALPPLPGEITSEQWAEYRQEWAP